MDFSEPSLRDEIHPPRTPARFLMNPPGTYSSGVERSSQLYRTSVRWLACLLLGLCPTVAPSQPNIAITLTATDAARLQLTPSQVPSLYSVHFAPTLEALESNPAVLSSGLAQGASQTVAVPMWTEVPRMFFRLAELPLSPDQWAILTNPGSVQTVTVDGVSVTLPAGTLAAPAAVAVVGRPAAEAGIPPAPYGLETFQVYDIQVGSETRFQQDLTVTLPYDPARLNPDLPVEDAMAVSCWLPESRSWKSVPHTVDPIAGVVRFSTPHLSTWAVRYIARGWRVLKSDQLHARVVFDPTQPVFRGKTRIPAQDYAQLIADAGEAAYSAYQTAGFKISEEQWYIVLDSAESPEPVWSGWSGDVFLPSMFDDDEEVRYNVGHELFHSVQNAYYNIFSASGRQWWHEACATYASWHYLFDRGYPFRTPDVNARDYPALPISTVNRAHEYVTAELLAFLFARSGLTFKAHFDAMEGYGVSSTITRLEDTVKSKTNDDLHRFYRLFCGDYWLNRAGVLTHFDPALNPDGTPASLSVFEVGQTRADFAFDLRGGYTGQLDFWKMESSGGNRDVTIEIDAVEGKASVDVYVLPSFQGQGNVWPKGMLLNAGTTLEVTVPANHFLVLVAVNYDASANSAIGGFITAKTSTEVLGPIQWSSTVDAGNPDSPAQPRITADFNGTWRAQGPLDGVKAYTLFNTHNFTARWRGDMGDLMNVHLSFTATISLPEHSYTANGRHTVISRELRYESTEPMIGEAFDLREWNTAFGQLSARIAQARPRGPDDWLVARFVQNYTVYFNTIETRLDTGEVFASGWTPSGSIPIEVRVNY